MQIYFTSKIPLTPVALVGIRTGIARALGIPVECLCSTENNRIGTIKVKMSNQDPDFDTEKKQVSVCVGIAKFIERELKLVSYWQCPADASGLDNFWQIKPL